MLDNELFEYLQAAAKAGRTSFRLAITRLEPGTGELRFILHPLNEDGVTMDVTLAADGLAAEAIDVEWNRNWDQYQHQAA
jgi:hypothetical protein